MVGIVGKSQSGRACAEPASRPAAPRSGGGATRRALTPVSTRARCWLDDADGDHNILRSTGVQFRSDPRERQQLQQFADRTGLTIDVSHFPPGTSKWNKIEHRLFCHITANWRGTPLATWETIVDRIGNTRTAAGLRAPRRSGHEGVSDGCDGDQVTDGRSRPGT